MRDRLSMLVKLGQLFLGGNVLGEFFYATGKSCGVFGPFHVSPIDPPAGRQRIPAACLYIRGDLKGSCCLPPLPQKKKP